MNPETDLKDAAQMFREQQRQAALKWETTQEDKSHPKASKKYKSRYFTKYHDQFDYFKWLTKKE